MKPNFALDFRNDAITLLHRTSRGWQQVGQVRLDAADVVHELAVLRSTALELSPSGMTTKLVIPNEQILYKKIPVTAQDAGRRRKQVGRALEGVTPYAVADLAFDVSGSVPLVDVAVIAKETLAEAEAFATDHRFNPVSFVAVPDPGSFASEPWFGPTSTAATHLAEGQRVERDSSPVVIIGKEPAAPAALPFAAARVEVAAQPAAPEPVDSPAQPVAPPQAEKLQETGADSAPQPEVAVVLPASDAGSLVEVNPPFDPNAAETPASDLPPEPAFPAAQAEAEPAPADTDPVIEPEPEVVLARQRAQEAEAASQPPLSAPPALAAAALQPEPLRADLVAAVPAVAAPVDEAPMALDVVDDRVDGRADDQTAPPNRPTTASVLDPSIPEDVPPPPSASVMVAFGSRRALEASAREAAARAGVQKPAVPRPTASAKAPALGSIGASRSGPTAKVTTLPSRPPQPSVVRLPPRPGAQGTPALLEKLNPPARPALKPASRASAAGKALRGLGALVTAPGIAGAKERRPAPPQMVTPPTGPTSAASAAAATLNRPAAKPYSGGLGNRSMERPKPRYLGLFLTGVLLVFLVLVAAWSTLFLEARNTATPDAGAVVVSADPAIEAPAIEDEMLADLQDPQAEAAAPLTTAPLTTVPQTAAPLTTAVDAEPAPLPEVAAPAPTAALPEPTPDAEAEAIADAVAAAAPVAEPAPIAEPAPFAPLDTDAAALAPLVASPQDEFLLATMDAPPEMPDALSLPQPQARNDAPPGPAVPPPPFGTVIQFDADGLVVPTPEGILTPDGVLLFAGRPTLEPPPRPASLAAPAAPLAPAPAATAPAAATTASTAGIVAPAPPEASADPAPADARPRPRPEGLAPATQNADDDASLAPADDSRFASLRPQAKPAALAEAPAPPPADPIAALGARGASLAAQAAATASQGALALAVSRKPARRPSDMSAAVEAAVAIASRQPDPAPPVEEAAARAEPEADEEPEVASAMPRLPTTTTVAKQATYVNAINLSKVNLIGIYGSSSDRHALIRQTNGRYKKVMVGDSFDGGRIAAITASEVRYQKSGKMLTLALPKG